MNIDFKPVQWNLHGNGTRTTEKELFQSVSSGKLSNHILNSHIDKINPHSFSYDLELAFMKNLELTFSPNDGDYFFWPDVWKRDILYGTVLGLFNSVSNHFITRIPYKRVDSIDRKTFVDIHGEFVGSLFSPFLSFLPFEGKIPEINEFSLELAKRYFSISKHVYDDIVDIWINRNRFSVRTMMISSQYVFSMEREKNLRAKVISHIGGGIEQKCLGNEALSAFELWEEAANDSLYQRSSNF